MRRWISLVVALAMFMPAAASVADGMATWLSPQPGQIVSGGKVEVAIGYNTQSKLKVSSIELYVDGQFLMRKVLRAPEPRGVCSFWWDTTREEQGTHNLVVKVFAGDRMISKIYGTGTVGPKGSSRGLLDMRPPVVTFANIKAGDVLKGTSTIKMNAADDSGQAPMVSLLVDDVLKLLKNTPPYNYDLDTTTYSNGDHSLKTYAYDGAGNRSDPAVVKVEFRNGSDKPVVTTLSVNNDPEVVMPVASASKTIPPSVSVNAQSRIKKSAARSETQIENLSSSVAPVVAEPKAKPAVRVSLSKPKLDSNLRSVSVSTRSELRSARIAPKMDDRMAAAVPNVKMSAKRVAPILSEKPVRVALAASYSEVRKYGMKSAMSSESVSSKPSIMESPRTSGIRSASAAQLPVAKSTLRATPAIASITESAAPKIIEPRRVALATTPCESKPVMSAPRQSGPTRMAMAVPISELRGVSPKVCSVPATVAAAPDVIAPGMLSKANLKRVRVAMAPNLRSAKESTHPSPAISIPPSIQKSTKAKIEKTTIPASGKVKARKFFEKMGGALFWDPSTHTVTACVRGMVLEMQIGSKIAKVNGQEFKMESAPYLVDNRTIFDVKSFTQACALMDNLKNISKANI